MKYLKNLTALIAIAFTATVILLPSCKKLKEHCDKVNATGKGQIVSQTATGAVTESEINGSGLNGTTLATLEFTGVDPITGNLLFEGTLVLTAKKGTLTFNLVNGKLNPATGEFSNDAVVTGGTGGYDGATGNLYFHGFTYPDGSFIDDEVSGEICKSRSYNYTK